MRLAVLLLAAACALVGCSSWRPVPSAAYDAESGPSRLIPGRARLVLRDGTEIVVEDVAIARDSIRATRIVSVRAGTMSSPHVEKRKRFAIATSELARVDDYEASFGKSVGAYFFALAAGIGALFTVAVASE